MLRLAPILLAVTASTAFAGSHLQPGDLGLKSDIRILADYGVITGPTSAWPLSWDALLSELRVAVDAKISVPYAVEAKMLALLARAERETARVDPRAWVGLGVAEKPTRIRGFEYAPRENAEASMGANWRYRFLTLELAVTGVDEAVDDKDVRADGSAISVDFGNYQVAASAMNRWWGPGWDGSQILSNNARPIPALTIGRNQTTPFKTRWLSWMGPWDVTVIWGQLEEQRAVPNARFFGMRVDIRPIPSLEIGFSRSALWCGNGRPCGADTFWDIFIGNDNLGDNDITFETEPSNQLAGVDVRWRNMWLETPMAFYAQAIGEDEAGGFPSRYMGMGGVEISGTFGENWTYRGFAELASNSCDVLDSPVGFNCAYNHNIYETGYRYRGRVIGHPAENDARIGSAGFLATSTKGTQWQLVARSGDLNRGGAPDIRNTLTSTPQEIQSVDVTWARSFRFGRIAISAGYERVDDELTGIETDETRAFITWSSR